MLRSILVPVDGSPLAERAVAVALDIARRAGGAVHLVRVHVPLAIVGATAEGVFTQDMLAADEALRARAKTYVDELAKRLGAEWGVRVEARVADGSPASVITETAEAVQAGLIVMTTHGAGGFAPDWLGSVCDAVIRHSHRPVLALPENDTHAMESLVPKRLMVPLDGSARADAAIPVARDLALVFGAEIDIVRMVAPYVPNDVAAALAVDRPDPYGIDAEAAEAKASIDTVVADLQRRGIKARAIVRMELNPVRALMEHIAETNPDVVVIATQGRGLSRLFVGSVADKLIRAARRPVLALRPMKD